MATRLTSSSSAIERRLRLAEPMLATSPSTVMTLACSIDGWKFQISMPASSSSAYAALAGELHEPLVGVRSGQQDLDLDAPVARRRRAGSMSSSSGTKYAVVMRTRCSASCSSVRNSVSTSLQPVSDALRTHCTIADARLGLVGEAVDVVVEELRIGLGPVVEERGAQPVDGRAPEAEVRVAPLVLVRGRRPSTRRRCRRRR